MTLLTVLGGALAGFIGSRWADLSQAFPVLTASGVLVAATGFFSRYGTDLWQPFKRAMDRHAQLKTKYSQRQGFTAEANQDIGHLIKAITHKPDKARNWPRFPRSNRGSATNICAACSPFSKRVRGSAPCPSKRFCG